MKWRALALLAFVIGAIAPACAWNHGSTPSVCYFDPSRAIDGCNGANQASNFKVLHFYTCSTALCAAQSGQTLAHTPENPISGNSWYLPGVDYPVGYYTPQGSLQDPATAATGSGFQQLPSVCTYYTNATGHTAPANEYPPNGRAGTAIPYPEVYCANSAATINISGFEFGPTGGHPCTILYLAASFTGTANISDSDFINDATCDSFHASNSGAVALLAIAQESKSTVTVTFSSFNGMWADPCCNGTGWTGSAEGGMSGITYDGNNNPAGNLTVEYCNIINFSGPLMRYLSTEAPTSPPLGTFFVKYDYLNGGSNLGFYGHTDVLYFNGGAGVNNNNPYGLDFEYNTAIQPTQAVALGTSFLFNVGTASMAPYIVGHNGFFVGNFVDSTQTTPNPPNVSGFCCNTTAGTVGGHIFTLTSAPGVVGTGTSFTSWSLSTQIDSTHWDIDCGVTVNAQCPHPSPYTPVTAVTSAPTASGTVLNFAFTPIGITVGNVVPISDITNPSAIPSTALVNGVSNTTVTSTQTMTGVNAGDTISFGGVNAPVAVIMTNNNTFLNLWSFYGATRLDHGWFSGVNINNNYVNQPSASWESGGTVGYTVTTSGTTAAGNPTLSIQNYTGTTNLPEASGTSLHFAATPAGIASFMLLKDTTTPAAIPVGTVVSSFTGTTITTSKTMTGVLSGDTIVIGVTDSVASPMGIWDQTDGSAAVPYGTTVVTQTGGNSITMSNNAIGAGVTSGATFYIAGTTCSAKMAGNYDMVTGTSLNALTHVSGPTPGGC